MKTSVAVVLASPGGEPVARRLAGAFAADLYTLSAAVEGCPRIGNLGSFFAEHFADCGAWLFVGAMGICVRAVAPHLRDKHLDPAVVCIDSTGRWSVPVVSGHVGGANDWARRTAALLGGEAVVTTQSDNAGLWPLDTLAERFGWRCSTEGVTMNEAIARFVNGRPVTLLAEVRDEGAAWMERTAPAHVTVCHAERDIPAATELLIVLSPRRVEAPFPRLNYTPRVLTLGVGCRRDCAPEGIGDRIAAELEAAGWRPEAIGKVATVELKRNEPLVRGLAERFGARLEIYGAEELAAVEVPHPSERVAEATGSPSVAEASAILAAGGGGLVVEKRKGCLTPGSDFTFAAAQQAGTARRGHVEIVGAGPGDPDLISVRGRRMLESADLILYAGSLVPKEVTACAKPGAAVRSSAPMALEEQFALMKEFYDRGDFVVRLHTGDPCIYGAIQEQMNFFDRYGMSYHITPGISSFQAAAAELKSQFTIPERVQTIILTRGEGRTPMPEREKLHLLARSQSTMCIFLSAGVARDVQRDLLEHYPSETPVAVCYHLTWADQRIWRGELRELADIVERNRLTLTTLIVVGDAIDNRKGLSRLYAREFKHLFRP